MLVRPHGSPFRSILPPYDSPSFYADKLSAAEARIASLEAEVARLQSSRSVALPLPSLLLDSITDGFVALDNQFRYVWFNAESERLTGTPANRCLGKSSGMSSPIVAALFSNMNFAAR